MPVAPQLSLPIDEVLGALVAALRSSPNVVLCAPPGAGKTTRVPPALLDAGFAAAGKLVVLQPRRVAARATAARMAAECGSRLGTEIGYQVRFESNTGPQVRIEVVTEGILLRWLSDNPFLEGVAAVVFDEFHERSLNSDLALGMIRQVQQSVRPELKIVVMSATLAAEPVAAYLGDCPIVRSSGRTFAVDIRYLPQHERQPLSERVVLGVEQSLDATAGDCLVFLPGVGEIRQAAKRLRPLCDANGFGLHELYGDLPADKQDEALRPGARRKIILSTNVAETSLTIEGVTAVVDSGLARILRWDERTGLNRLELAPISKASADQRAGRAGRTANGVCFRLWPEAMQRTRPNFDTPELRRVDLAGAVLQLLCWIEPDLEAFPWFEAPPERAVQRALELLEQLNAVDNGQVTKLGQRLAGLPTHPRLARMLIEGARLGGGKRVALAAALIAEREPFVREHSPGMRPRREHVSSSDVLDRVVALEHYFEQGASQTPFGEINRAAARQIVQSQRQLVRLIGHGESRRDERLAAHDSDIAVLRSLLVGFPDRLARRREPGSPRGVMVGGKGVRLSERSAVAEAELFLCIDVEGSGAEAEVRQASAVERDWLPATHLRTSVEVDFDEATHKLFARRRVAWNGLVLEESPTSLPSGEALTVALAAAAVRHWDRASPADDSSGAAYVARVRSLGEWLPQLELPKLDDEQLQSLLPIVCIGKRSLDEVRNGPWTMAVKTLLTYPQQQAVDREAPERVAVPSGNQITLQYEAGRPPVLAVRIQEVFGMTETPRVAAGRVPVLMHLLAPNMRVAQVTADLKSFWQNGYPLVRKDLRARYPKHSWPEDPLTAPPQRRPTRKPSA